MQMLCTKDRLGAPGDRRAVFVSGAEKPHREVHMPLGETWRWLANA